MNLDSPVARRLMVVLWPAFIVAGALEALTFALIDPDQLNWFGRPLDLSRTAIYSLGFFVFWTMAALSGWMTAWLSSEPAAEAPRPRLADR